MPDSEMSAAAREILAPLLNPEPHPLQEQWSDAHSMSLSVLVERVERGLTAARQQGIEDAAKVAQGEWQPESNSLSPEYILRHKIAAAIRSLSHNKDETR